MRGKDCIMHISKINSGKFSASTMDQNCLALERSIIISLMLQNIYLATASPLTHRSFKLSQVVI